MEVKLIIYRGGKNKTLSLVDQETGETEYIVERLKSDVSIHQACRISNKYKHTVATVERAGHNQSHYTLFLETPKRTSTTKKVNENKPIQIRLESPHSNLGRKETRFQWKGRDLTWERDRKLTDSLTKDIIIDFKPSSCINRRLWKRKGILTLDPAALYLPRHEDFPAHPKPSNGTVARKLEVGLSNLRETLLNRILGNNIQASEEESEKLISDTSEEEGWEFELNMLVSVAVAIQHQWKSIRKKDK